MGSWPFQKPDKIIGVLCPPEVTRLHPSAQAEALQSDFCVQYQDRRKEGRIGGIEKRKERGKRKKGQQTFLFVTWLGHSGQSSASGGDQGQKGSGSSCWVWFVGK